MQRRLGLYLAVFASGVLVFSALQRSQTSVLTLRQAYINLGVAVVASLILVWPFPGLVQVFCGILRFTAPVAGLLFLVRGRWAYVPPLLLLGLVFQGCMWVAEEVKEGRGPSGMWRDIRYGLSRLRGARGSPIEVQTEVPPPDTNGQTAPRRGRRGDRSPLPYDPDQSTTPSSGSFIIRGPDEPTPAPPAGTPPGHTEPPDPAKPRDPTNPAG